jgi:hypothetical protein
MIIQRSCTSSTGTSTSTRSYRVVPVATSTVQVERTTESPSYRTVPVRVRRRRAAADGYLLYNGYSHAGAATRTGTAVPVL